MEVTWYSSGQWIRSVSPSPSDDLWGFVGTKATVPEKLEPNHNSSWKKASNMNAPGYRIPTFLRWLLQHRFQEETLPESNFSGDKRADNLLTKPNRSQSQPDHPPPTVQP